MAYWLFKTEPDTFSIDDLATCTEPELWEGIRNYQARNLLRDDVAVGDKVFIYHSSCKKIGIAGIAEVIETGLADPFQFDPESRYFDRKATPDNPRWYAVTVRFVEKFPEVLNLSTLKSIAELDGMVLLNRGRLSIQPVTEHQWQVINERAGAK